LVNGLRRPQNAVQPLLAAMEMIGPVIRGERVLPAIKRKLASSDAIAEAADRRAKIRMALKITLQIIETQVDLPAISRPIIRLHGDDRGSIVDHFHRRATRITECVERYLSSIRQPAKRAFLN